MSDFRKNSGISGRPSFISKVNNGWGNRTGHMLLQNCLEDIYLLWKSGSEPALGS